MLPDSSVLSLALRPTTYLRNLGAIWVILRLRPDGTASFLTNAGDWLPAVRPDCTWGAPGTVRQAKIGPCARTPVCLQHYVMNRELTLYISRHNSRGVAEKVQVSSDPARRKKPVKTPKYNNLVLADRQARTAAGP